MSAELQEQLSPADAEVILGHLPERIRTALRVFQAYSKNVALSHQPELRLLRFAQSRSQ